MIGLLLCAAATAASLNKARVANMTLDDALKAAKPEAVALFQQHTENKMQMRGQMKNLDRATEILNGMMTDTETQLDVLNSESIDILNKSEGELSMAQANIAAAQASLTDAISRLSDSLAQQKQSQESIDSVTIQLSEVTSQCHSGTAKLEHSLLLLRGDLNVTGNIVKMVKCEKAMLMQCIFLQENEDGVDRKGYYAFNHPEATEEMSTLQTKTARRAMQRALSQVYEGPDPMLFQMGTKRRRHHRRRRAKALEMSNTDPNQVDSTSGTVGSRSGADKQVAVATAPIRASKQESKCSLSKSKNCQKFLDQIMEMQGAIADEVLNLEDELHQLETNCEYQKTSFSQQVSDSEKVLNEAQTEISHATMEKTQYSETSRLLEEQVMELRNFIHEKNVEWHTKQTELEDTMCGIRKIRTEMFKFQGQDLVPEDCEVGDWSQDECSASCEGGKRREKREIISPPKNKGTACPALVEYTDCNVQPCPQDCEIGEWEGWSACSAECGGGVQTRNRAIIQDSKYGGEACGETQQTQTCNSENCDFNCELSDWMGWTPCSKACDTGFQRRKRAILKPARGAGECPPPGMKRREFQRCNLQACTNDIECNSKVDIMILLDSSGSMGDAGFKAVKKFGASLVKRFKTGEDKAMVGSVLFSGPGTWANWYKCQDGVGTEEECGLQLLSPLTEDMGALSGAIDGAKWIGATTNTAGALALAGNELQMGRQDATSVIFVVTDGDPNFKRKTAAAARRVKKSARLVFVPLGPYINLKNLKRWGSKPVRENVLPAGSAKDLEAMIPEFVADLCPKMYSKEEEAKAGGSKKS